MIQIIHPYIDQNREERPELVQHVSDSSKILRKIETGELFQNPVDIFPCVYTYEETEFLFSDN